jgi:hypothetical protein
VPTGWATIGKNIQYYMFFKKLDYPLSFDIAGYYDLKKCKCVKAEEGEKYGFHEFG